MPKPLPVIIPVFNRPKLLKQTLETCVNHSHYPIELIVIDDHSTQDIKSVVGSIKGAHRLRYYRTPRQLGPGTCLTYGAALVASSSDYFLFNGADTYYEKHWATRLLEAAGKHPSCGIISGETKDISDMDSPPHQTPLKVEPAHRFGLASLVSREAWLEAGPFPPKKLGVPGEDADLCEAIDNAGYDVGRTKPGICIHTGLTSVFFTKNNEAEKITRIRANRPEIYME